MSIWFCIYHYHYYDCLNFILFVLTHFVTCIEKCHTNKVMMKMMKTIIIILICVHFFNWRAQASDSFLFTSHSLTQTNQYKTWSSLVVWMNHLLPTDVMKTLERGGNQRRSCDWEGAGPSPVPASSGAASLLVPAAPPEEWKKRKAPREATNNGTHRHPWSRPPHLHCPHPRVLLRGARDSVREETDAVIGVVLFGVVVVVVVAGGEADESTAVHHCLRRNKNGLDVEGEWVSVCVCHSSVWTTGGGQEEDRRRGGVDVVTLRQMWGGEAWSGAAGWCCSSCWRKPTLPLLLWVFSCFHPGCVADCVCVCAV